MAIQVFVKQNHSAVKIAGHFSQIITISWEVKPNLGCFITIRISIAVGKCTQKVAIKVVVSSYPEGNGGKGKVGLKQNVQMLNSRFVHSHEFTNHIQNYHFQKNHNLKC